MGHLQKSGTALVGPIPYVSRSREPLEDSPLQRIRKQGVSNWPVVHEKEVEGKQKLGPFVLVV